MSRIRPGRPQTNRLPRHRRLIVALAVVAILESAAASLSAVALANGAASTGAPGPGGRVPTGGAAPVATAPAAAAPAAVAPAAAAPAAAAHRPPSPFRLLAGEVSGREIARTPARHTSDQAFDPVPPPEPEPPAPAEEPATPPPADAGVETAATAGGLAGVGRAVVAVPQRLRIPELGIGQTILQFPCNRSQPPDNFVYRWGCAGRNNLYLLGHAYSVFSPLHDAYAAGRLHVGMVAYYTASDGAVTAYRVTTWRLVRPDQVDWAIASQPVASMTLQTCYGANSEYRLLVRLVAS